ncbi:hypothetical protein [Rhizobium bangladeshense]|uniref:Uncharacterized protein n=1 Tax=Rhizobium bangladeshense TaxID=1138189 RepID=A0ABS7LHF1_9HYPH|nr:hypothetical protein [Rhizobium bangladeshense]MBX4870702.1 hypothetical protein [Rhizobium bangladeshense]MBX4872583.1 hypothetical protein [Rhizobium bangladeshense]MBX4883900.1 hypothetical protein [Rhizobium bangladeshense]MBX4889904.1 hypothetical protein [Rhizobium bangladeshense]MBX4895517.1 hypothetical protein [Rhizobium bangladeshense]
MHDATFGGTAKDIFFSLLARLKRISMSYANGGREDEWGYALVTEPVTDINTKMSITGHVMRKVVDGEFVHRQMTEDECEDFDAGRSW